MRFLLPLLLFLSAVLSLPGCEPKEDVLTTDSSAKLEFSSDTVKFDTVFVTVGTVTKRLWVYNRNRRAVRVEEISLQSRPGVTYSLLVNGDAGPAARNVEIRGRDSLLVLVRATIDPTPAAGKPFLVEDDLRFRTNGNDQQVKVLGYGQNAYFHDSEVLPCNVVWRNDKPHVIFNSVLVDSACTLTIEAGTRVYSHAGSFLVVRGRLLVNPTLAPTGELKPDSREFVRFQGDRLEEQYNDVPGQWGGIQFGPSSAGNVVRFAEIKNASFALFIVNLRNRQPRPQVRVENCVIQNISSAPFALAGGVNLAGAALLSISGDFAVRNTLLTNCAEHAVWAVQGGEYSFDYCTIANYTGRRETPSVLLANGIRINGQPGPLVAPRLTMRNSIVVGSEKDELELVNGEQYASGISIRNTLLRTEKYAQTGPLALTGNGNVLNPTASIFKSTPQRPRGRGFDYQLDTLSPASNQGLPLPTLRTDLLLRPRDAQRPDLGAYERKNP
ncbi:hypothetical protein [Hymenobacter weizhouensis]|uniref:hypothetical protein n=1 Tax=Hymenobacter sp. YIM 151500-1 TaxID=2987689 RepID=UPI002227AEFA|nr:hypothetical protein [Hymenobacter sp. YIM 151500-1]UYZ62405.1 hypothetical protein OIS53_15565 [Hymenobacter sp. YIM 151500-1]